MAFEKAKEEIAQLRARAQAGEIELAYLDEAGFGQVHPNRAAWTLRGEQHEIEAMRGKRLNVVAALLSSGRLISSKLWCAFKAPVFADFVEQLKQEVSKPLTIILDNASIHKAKSIAPLMQSLQERGVSVYFLPPYCPELNRIEKLWYLAKHRWMSPKQRNAQSLEEDVSDILDNFGTRYRMAF